MRRLKCWKIIAMSLRCSRSSFSVSVPQISSADDNLTARRPLQIIQTPHQGTFPGTGHSNDSVDVSLLNVERDIPQRFHAVSLLLEGL